MKVGFHCVNTAGGALHPLSSTKHPPEVTLVEFGIKLA